MNTDAIRMMPSRITDCFCSFVRLGWLGSLVLGIRLIKGSWSPLELSKWCYVFVGCSPILSWTFRKTSFRHDDEVGRAGIQCVASYILPTGVGREM